jgi:hypothetical protein
MFATGMRRADLLSRVAKPLLEDKELTIYQSALRRLTDLFPRTT